MVSSEEEVETKSGDGVEWDVDMEIQLFYAMANHKPVGINKYFQMACIWEKLTNATNKEISTRDIWKHLESLYDLNILDDTEPIPFPNQETNFVLPESEFGALIKQKCKETTATPATVEESDTGARSPSPKPSTPRSSSRGTASKDSTPKAGPSRKDSVSALATKSRKESGSSHASTDTPSVKSEKEYDRRRDSRDSNASGPRESSSNRKSTSQRDRGSKGKEVDITQIEQSRQVLIDIENARIAAEERSAAALSHIAEAISTMAQSQTRIAVAIENLYNLQQRSKGGD